MFYWYKFMVLVPLAFQNIAALPHTIGMSLMYAAVNSLKHKLVCVQTHMEERLNILTSHQCIIIPKQTIINEPSDAYLSEWRQPPPPLPLGWGCHSDRFTDIWGERERRRGGGLKGRGCRGEVEGNEMGICSRTLALCLFQIHLFVSSVSQSSMSVRGNSSWTFLNQVSVLAVFPCAGKAWSSCCSVVT